MKRITLISLLGVLGSCVSTDNPAQSWATYYEKTDAQKLVDFYLPLFVKTQLKCNKTTKYFVP